MANPNEDEPAAVHAPIVMYGHIRRAKRVRFSNGLGLSVKTLVSNPHPASLESRSSARLHLESVDLPIDCLCHKVRVTVEVLDELDESEK